MIAIPYETLVEKIVEQSDLSKEDVETRVQSKMKQLSGLISKEGAAHIVANELHITIVHDTSSKVKMKDVMPGLRDIEVVGKIQRKYELRSFEVSGRTGKVASLMLADETGRMRLVMWGTANDKFEQMKEGDILQVKGAYVRENNNYTELHSNDRSTVEINPEGESIDVALEPLTKTSRKSISELTEEDSDVEVLATIVDVNEPRYFEVCPECSKRVRPGDDGTLACQAHPEAVINFSYVLNAFLDDGTDNIRGVFFKEQAEKLFGKSSEEMVSLRGQDGDINTIRTSLLGQIVKVKGRVSKNQMFDRTEFIVRNIDLNPDPKAELERAENGV